MHSLTEPLLSRLVQACRDQYAERLVSLVLFGSTARGTSGPDSDVDLLIVSEGLPEGRVARVREFMAVERQLEAEVRAARLAGWNVELSPVFKTPAEVQQGSPLFLDMLDDAQLLYDREDFMRHALDLLRARLAALGARRIWRGNAWYWDLKPDYRPGDVFEI
jgi:predicted nucleotidyltransferase